MRNTDSHRRHLIWTWLLSLAACVIDPARLLSDEEPSGSPLGTPTSPAVISRTTSSPLDGPSINQQATWSELFRAILLTAIPDNHENRKHWGSTREIVSGLRVQQRGIFVHMSPRTKFVNDGTWYKYKVEFPNPDRNIKLVINQVETLGPGHFAFMVHLSAKPRCTGRFEQWTLGVKGLNFSVVSNATVQMHAACQLKVRTEPKPRSLLPDVVFEPSIDGIKLQLVDIDTQRIGLIRGDIAEALGNGSREFVEDLLREQEPKVLKKARAAIAKKRDSLRLSPSSLW